MRKFLFFLFSLILLEVHGQDGEVEKRIAAVENNLIPYVPVKGFKGWNILDRMRYYKVPGLSIAVIRNYRIDWAKAYGVADTNTKEPVTTETMFSVGSISKFLMAVAALKLVEEGKINLDSPVNRYLSSWKIRENELTLKKPVTLRMLLSHTGGTTQASYFGFTPDRKNLPSIVDILNGEKIAESRMVVVNSEPGKEFRYSGGGSMIAQLALMDISSTSFADLTKRMLFDPLRMAHSTFQQPLPEQFSRKAAWAYSAAPWFRGAPYVYPQQAAAGLYTTPIDLAKFFIDIQLSYLGKGKLLGAAMTRLMLRAQVEVSNGTYREQMGIGPFLIQRSDNKDPAGVYFEFTGVNAGFLAYGIASVEGGNGVIIMLNSGDDQNGIGKEIRRAVAKVYNWKNYLPDEIRPMALSVEALDKMAGRYRMGKNEVLYLRREGNYLVERINKGNDIYCFPVSKDTIVFTDFNVKGYFRFNDAGEAVSLQSVWQERPMPRMVEGEFTANEYLEQRKFPEAKAAFRDLGMNEYQLTYLAYDLMNRIPADLEGAALILELAKENFPSSSIVYSRWGDYYVKKKDRTNALKNYQQALALDPADEQLKEMLKSF